MLLNVKKNQLALRLYSHYLKNRIQVTYVWMLPRWRLRKWKKALESRLKGFSGNGTLFYEVFCFQAVWKAVWGQEAGVLLYVERLQNIFHVLFPRGRTAPVHNILVVSFFCLSFLNSVVFFPSIFRLLSSSSFPLFWLPFLSHFFCTIVLYRHHASRSVFWRLGEEAHRAMERNLFIRRRCATSSRGMANELHDPSKI